MAEDSASTPRGPEANEAEPAIEDEPKAADDAEKEKLERRKKKKKSQK